MKLGQRVKCKSYLKKLKLPFVFANEKHMSNFKGIEHIPTDKVVILEDCVEFKTHDVVAKNFNGIVIGKKRISTMNYYEKAEDEFGELLDATKVEKWYYIDCYHVAYRMGGTRLVPIEDCEVIDDEMQE